MSGPSPRTKRRVLGLALLGFAALSGAAHAQDPFIGEIKMFGGNFAPRGWAFCEGQLLPIASNTALFSLLGTTYGGDGRTTFALPDMRGRLAGHNGRGPGLTTRKLGQSLGAVTKTLTVAEMPAHSHSVSLSHLKGSSEEAEETTPKGGVPGTTEEAYYGEAGPMQGSLNPDSLGPMTISRSGSGQPYNITPPVLGLRYIIALVGVYPSRG